MPDRNITFEIREHLGTIAKYDTNWRKELNIISWNGGTPKFDIRDWDEGHVKMSRGITLSLWEMRKMVDLYISRNNERAVARGRAIEEERNALREASFKQHRDASGFGDGVAETAAAAGTGESTENAADFVDEDCKAEALEEQTEAVMDSLPEDDRVSPPEEEKKDEEPF